MPNRLADSTSPYLLQHAHNPVDWYPWGEEAFQIAREQNKPIFLSIGYAACHWCHVMAHESFEDEQTAALLNRDFVAIKVDREERPDVDSVFMDAVVAMTGQGGWPMSVFLTPDRIPFFGGTYYPPTRRYGMPSFMEVLHAVSKAWQENPQEIMRTGKELAHHLRQSSKIPAQRQPLLPGLFEQAATSLIHAYSQTVGGWGRAPLFPQPMLLEALLIHASRGNQQAAGTVLDSLLRMAQGGMYDLINGGFHRYSVDDAWYVPHFEKMLYDNAQLALVYTHGWQYFHHPRLRQVAEETLEFIIRELTHPRGGFLSSLDADSGGGEGRYYLFSETELRGLPPGTPAGQQYAALMDSGVRWRFEGEHLLRLQDLAPAGDWPDLRRELHTIRQQKPYPALDDKVVLGWNGLALIALAEAARIFDRPDFLSAAQKNANFLLANLRSPAGLSRSWREGRQGSPAFLEDYGALCLGLLALHQADLDLRWFSETRAIAKDMVARFAGSSGHLSDNHPEHGELFMGVRNLYDNATPSGNALAWTALLHLSELTTEPVWAEKAETALAEVQDDMLRNPAAFGQWLQLAAWLSGERMEIALAGDPGSAEVRAFHQVLNRRYLPQAVWAAGVPGSDGLPGLLEGRELRDGRPAAYLCRSFTCLRPTTDPAELERQLNPPG